MIPISEKLPPENTEVLTYDHDTKQFDVGYLKRGYWMNRYGTWAITVTHWQPLPDMEEAHGLDVCNGGDNCH